MRVGQAIVAAALLLGAGLARGEEPVATIRVDAAKVTHAISPFTTGVCIEDVNHEIYGGLYSQMIFGESFQEPPPAVAPKGFVAYGGAWDVKEGGVLLGGAGDGPKLLAEYRTTLVDEVGVEMRFADASPGLAGLIVKVGQAATGADRWVGYEVSLDPERQRLIFGRHRNNWEPIAQVPCKVPVGAWVKLNVRMTNDALEVWVDGQSVYKYDGPARLPDGRFGLRTWRKPTEFRNLAVRSADVSEGLAFEAPAGGGAAPVSGMWRAWKSGAATGSFAIEKTEPFTGVQSQRVTFEGGEGGWGIENRGLNRQGMSVVAGRPYEGYVWLRCERPTDVRVGFLRDGRLENGRARLRAEPGGWKRYDFTLTPGTTDPGTAFAMALDAPGSVVVGHAFVQPGAWGRFNGLPVRKDVVDGLRAAGVTVVRYGGSMVNAEGYRWKKMIGPRDRRPPYRGHWYEHSTNGWGVIDFLDLCEAAGFLAIPDLNVDESPQDVADFVEYVNGPADSEWGRRRAADGHAKPYGLKYLQLGNEEAVDEAYRAKFEALADAIWRKDASIVPVVGDFEFKRAIADPFDFRGAPRIRSLAAHQKILEFAKARGKAVWFDVHVWNDGPGDCRAPIAGLTSMADWLEKLVPGADFKVCVFEENANNHAVRRALAHAETIHALQRLGARVPIVCAANGLQVDGQNDNGWDQGLLFMNPAKVWPQPSYFVTQMVAQNAVGLPNAVAVTVEGGRQAPLGTLDVLARANAERTAVAVQVVNPSDRPARVRLGVENVLPAKGVVRVTRIAGEVGDTNTAGEPGRVVPQTTDEAWPAAGGAIEYTFPASSFTVLRLE